MDTPISDGSDGQTPWESKQTLSVLDGYETVERNFPKDPGPSPFF